jgi:hypothetical protein
MQFVHARLLKVALAIGLLVGTFVFFESKPLLACAACIHCNDAVQEESRSVCMPSTQVGSIYCTWDCVLDPDGEGYHPENIQCGPSGCQHNCWC